MNKRFLVTLIAVVLGLAGIFWLSGSDSPTTNTEPTSHTLGQGSLGITLLEYGDYQCSVCAAYHPLTKQVAEKYDKEILFQYRHLPLTQIHQNAVAAARAAEAAGKQGKFWEMHNRLFENQVAWSSASSAMTFFESYAETIGLDITRFKEDFASSEVNNRINADIAAFNKTGAEQATPTFFINGRKIDNSEFVDKDKGIATLDKFSEVIDAELAKAKE